MAPGYTLNGCRGDCPAATPIGTRTGHGPPAPRSRAQRPPRHPGPSRRRSRVLGQPGASGAAGEGSDDRAGAQDAVEEWATSDR